MRVYHSCLDKEVVDSELLLLCATKTVCLFCTLAIFFARTYERMSMEDHQLLKFREYPFDCGV